MLHFGKNPQGELELRATEDDVLILYRTICSAGLQERRTLHPVKALIEGVVLSMSKSSSM